MKLGAIIAIIVGVLAATVLGTALAKRRREREVSELNRHPERLEQSLDETDDA